jgi:hypothetical protein
MHWYVHWGCLYSFTKVSARKWTQTTKTNNVHPFTHWWMCTDYGRVLVIAIASKHNVGCSSHSPAMIEWWWGHFKTTRERINPWTNLGHAYSNAFGCDESTPSPFARGGQQSQLFAKLLWVASQWYGRVSGWEDLLYAVYKLGEKCLD